MRIELKNQLERSTTPEAETAEPGQRGRPTRTKTAHAARKPGQGPTPDAQSAAVYAGSSAHPGSTNAAPQSPVQPLQAPGTPPMRTTSPEPMHSPASMPLSALEHLLGADVVRQLSPRTPIKFSLASRDWSAVTSIDRSELGLNGGVFFASADSVRPLVIKEGGDQTQFLAAKFLEYVDLVPPESDLIHADSPEGQAIRGALMQHVSEYQTSAARETHFLLMEFVDGAAVQHVLNPSPYLSHIQHADFLSKLGELVVWDMVMCNPDRINLQENNTNLGNLMCTSRHGQLKPIDSAFNTHDEITMGFAKITVKKILRGDEHPALKVFQLLNKHLKMSQDQEQPCVQHIAVGMRKAAAALRSEAFPTKWAAYLREMKGFGIERSEIPDALIHHQHARQAPQNF